uniref:Uncharacterized protein n=1 Tax=Thermodesulfobacterium geofontis TaxID=1295609 RepID=A0A7V4N4J5_9BACT
MFNLFKNKVKICRLINFEDYNEVLVGEVKFDIIASKGNFIVEGKVSNMKCEGEVTLTYIPLSLSF